MDTGRVIVLASLDLSGVSGNGTEFAGRRSPSLRPSIRGQKILEKKTHKAICLVCSWLLVSGAISAEYHFLPYTGEPVVKPAEQAFHLTDLYVESGDRIRLCTYNIEDFFDGYNDGPRRTPEHARRQARVAARIIDQINPDVMVLQEIENVDVLRLLNDRLKRPFAVAYLATFGQGQPQQSKLNLAVMSRRPIRNAKNIDFSPLEGRGRPTRGLLRFEIEVDDETLLLVYNVHLKSNWGTPWRNISQRHYALNLLRNDADSWSEKRGVEFELIVAGDFNVDPEIEQFEGDPSLEPLADLVDHWEGRPLEERITIPTRYGDPHLEFPPAAFDRFYSSEGLTREPWVLMKPYVLPKGVAVENVHAAPGEDDTTASDHYPVYIDLYRMRN